MGAGPGPGAPLDEAPLISIAEPLIAGSFISLVTAAPVRADVGFVVPLSFLTLIRGCADSSAGLPGSPAIPVLLPPAHAPS